MPLTLPGASSFSFFKSPSLTTTPPISNNEPVSIPTITAATSSTNLNNKTAVTTETRGLFNTVPVDSRIDNDDIKSEKISISSLLNPVVSAERRARSVDAAISRSRRGSNCSSRASNKKSVWFKTFMIRLQQTFFRFNNESEDQVKADDDVSLSQARLSVDAVRQAVCDEATNEEENNNNVLLSDNRDIGSACFLLQQRKYGNFISDNEILKDPPSTSSSLSSSSSPHRRSVSSIFEICAQIPRHKTKELEVLRQVGRFTIVREREDFDTIIFDQCHCLQKPCKYSSSGGVHPPSPPELLPDLMSHSPQTQDINGVHRQPRNSRSSSLTSQTGPPSVYGYQFYSQPPSISSSSRRSLPCLCSSNKSNSMNVNIMNTIPLASTSRVLNATSSIPCRQVLPTSASSPNLMNMHNRSKNEGGCNNNKLRLQSSVNIHVTNGAPASTTVRAKRSSIVSMHQEFISNKRYSSVSVAPTPPSSLHISLPSKTPIPSHESHATISSHSGRKFEVERYSSSISSSSNSSTSSEFASSPASTSSVFSFASSPGTNSHSPTTTLNRQRSNTLSSKHGRKFEVTVVSLDNDATSNN